MRLNRFLSMAGIASRRKADELIEQKQVYVNDQLVIDLGTKVDPAKDEVKFNGTIVKIIPQRIHLFLYKPVGYLTTLNDPHGRPTVKDLLHDIAERVYPVGRLDFDTEGLLMITNDGKLTHRLLHPKYHVKKTYIATVKGVPSKQQLEKFRNGIQLEDGLTAPAEVDFIKMVGATSQLRIVLHEGKKRQIRRMCQAIDHSVLHLKRTHFDKFDLANLSPGKYRHLTKSEVNYLRRLVGLNTQ